MIAYQLIKELEKLPYFNDLLKAGVVAINWVDYTLIYESYLEEVERLKSEEGYSNTKARVQSRSNMAEQFKISELTVKWIIRKLKN